MPAALARRPELDVLDYEMARAFAILSASRTAGFSSPNPIQVSEIIAYAQVAGFDPHELIHLVQAMDAEFFRVRAQIVKTEAQNIPVSAGG